MLMRDAAAADDLAQETLLKAFQGIESFKERTGISGGGGGAKAWLMTILRHARIDRIRSTARDRNNISLEGAELDLADPNKSTPELTVTNPEELLEQLSDATLISALQELPEEIRWTMLLVEVQGLSHAEAGAVLGVPEGTVKSRTFRGRGMLKTHLIQAKTAKSTP